jgi:hypothetical protein
MRIGFYAPDRMLVLSGTRKGDRGEFLRHPDESLAWFRFGHRVHRKID